eukprot:4050552-Pleurochrysis_carterae.AAC.1
MWVTAKGELGSGKQPRDVVMSVLAQHLSDAQLTRFLSTWMQLESWWNANVGRKDTASRAAKDAGVVDLDRSTSATSAEASLNATESGKGRVVELEAGAMDDDEEEEDHESKVGGGGSVARVTAEHENGAQNESAESSCNSSAGPSFTLGTELGHSDSDLSLRDVSSGLGVRIGASSAVGSPVPFSTVANTSPARPPSSLSSPVHEAGQLSGDGDGSRVLSAAPSSVQASGQSSASRTPRSTAALVDEPPADAHAANVLSCLVQTEHAEPNVGGRAEPNVGGRAEPNVGGHRTRLKWADQSIAEVAGASPTHGSSALRGDRERTDSPEDSNCRT